MEKTIIEISKPVEIIQIDKQYKITSKEIKKILRLERGEIIGISLYSGRSPNQREQGKSPDTDIWEISIREVLQEKK